MNQSDADWEGEPKDEEVMRMGSRRFEGASAAASVIALMLVWMTPQMVLAEEGAEKVVKGDKLYTQYCSVCHGADGRGHTGMSGMLRIETPDLTKIALRRSGWFPEVLVREIIDGRFVIHGDGKMPIWGQVLRQDQIIAITDHLRSLQSRLP